MTIRHITPPDYFDFHDIQYCETTNSLMWKNKSVNRFGEEQIIDFDFFSKQEEMFKLAFFGAKLRIQEVDKIIIDVKKIKMENKIKEF